METSSRPASPESGQEEGTIEHTVNINVPGTDGKYVNSIEPGTDGKYVNINETGTDGEQKIFGRNREKKVKQ